MVPSEAEIRARLADLRRRREALDREIADHLLYLELGRRLRAGPQMDGRTDGVVDGPADGSPGPSTDGPADPSLDPSIDPWARSGAAPPPPGPGHAARGPARDLAGDFARDPASHPAQAAPGAAPPPGPRAWTAPWAAPAARPQAGAGREPARAAGDATAPRAPASDPALDPALDRSGLPAGPVHPRPGSIRPASVEPGLWPDRAPAPVPSSGMPAGMPAGMPLPSPPPAVPFEEDPAAARRYGRALVEAALAVLTEANRPMHAGEILEHLAARGFAVPGQDPVAALNTRLWKRSGPGGPLRRLGDAVYDRADGPGSAPSFGLPDLR